MSSVRRRFAAYVLALWGLLFAVPYGVTQDKRIGTLQELGGAFFADRNLSFSRKQNCVSCHSPELAFTDPRQLGEVQGAVSRGGDGHSLGDRNAPALAYAALTPRFHLNQSGEPEGGMFHDGRATGLEEQAVAPLTNPVEMAMPDRASVVARLTENPSYVDAYARLFGAGTLDDVDKAYWALGLALAAFERTAQFQPFDSRYDRSLRGEIELSDREKAGRDVFFSAKSSCSRCHLSDEPNKGETFSNARYYNLGVPANARVRVLNGKSGGFIDQGLTGNPAMAERNNTAGRYRVPTLRNVAITGPYMHNGAFQDLRTAIRFHERHNTASASRHINPETSAPWAPPEVEANIAHAELAGPPLDDMQIDTLIAFLQTLTDQRYEHLLHGP